MIGVDVAQKLIAGLSQTATGGLVSAVWQGLLLATVVGLGLRLLPRTPAAVRFAIWFAAFLLVVALPVASIWPYAEGAVRPRGQSAWLTLDARWSVAIAAVWVAASLMRAGTLVMAALRVRTLWKRAKPIELEGACGLHPALHDSAVQDGARAELEGTPGLTDKVFRNLRVARRAQICTSNEVDRPTVIGFFSPKILIPTWLLEKLTAVELEQIVLHETGHLGRADDWMNLLQKIALVVFPLNPALAWIERRLCFERELACDERVLRTTRAPKAYAACLATVAEHRMGRSGLALALGALGRESDLGRRVGRILRRGEMMRPLHARLVLGGAMLGLLGGAVSLERCPQVVGFAAAPDQNAGVLAAGSGGAVAGRMHRDAYEAVVFHPKAPGGETVERPGFVADHSNGGSHACANNSPCAMKLREHGAPRFVAAERDVALRNETDGSRRFVGTPTVQWLVVTTAWHGEDGSRLVLAMARTSISQARVFSDSVEPASDGPDTDRPQTGGAKLQQSEEVYPYAAVPVQGGWLVFQL